MNNPAHWATYDGDGNVILPKAESLQPHAMEPNTWHAVENTTITASANGEHVNWQTTTIIEEHVSTVSRATQEIFREGAHQYSVSIQAVPETVQELRGEVKGAMQSVWGFLTQPVWVPTRTKKVKQYSRMSLFFLDILRFGGTFTLIFVVLFVALNYQSFWQIASARLAPFLENPSMDSAGQKLQQDMPWLDKEKRAEGNLLSFLPPVGPPQNRMIIPKLNLNVPLINPSTAALINQNWDQVEKDIQHGLQEGVVHYPGTAKAGQAGNFFITGHSSYYPWDPGRYKTVFARLQELNVGDEYTVYYNGDRHRYIVDTKKEVKPSDVSVLDQPADKRISTLMTCTPVGTTLRRLILVSREVDPLTGETMAVGQQPREEQRAAPLQALPI
ncbi:MAG: putative sortase [Candidatus Peribacteria bacterium]|nr:putative sortase [Candidatus Peribacteria bacterium]